MRHAAALGLDVDIQATDKAPRASWDGSATSRSISPPCPGKRCLPSTKACQVASVTDLALRLLILTAVRSYPLRHIREDQIDGDIWTIPAEAMKGRVGAVSDFRVPLSSGGAGGHSRGPQVRAGRLPVPRSAQGRHFRHDHDEVHGPARDGGAAAWLPLILPRLDGGSDQHAPRGCRDGAGPCLGRFRGTSISADRFSATAARALMERWGKTLQAKAVEIIPLNRHAND
jgi:hypothetical protein